jgi:hypothetical protein
VRSKTPKAEQVAFRIVRDSNLKADRGSPRGTKFINFGRATYNAPREIISITGTIKFRDRKPEIEITPADQIKDLAS